MGRWCYCSKVLLGKRDQIREHWKKKAIQQDISTQEDEEKFWKHLRMTGFDSWLQATNHGDFIIHCLEGDSLNQIFKGLREQIDAKNPIALKLQKFYLETLGKDYHLAEIEPRIESLLDISLPSSSNYMKRAFFYPLLPHKEQEHRHFKEQAMGEKRGHHEAMMQAFGVSKLSTWIQTTSLGKYIVVYTEQDKNTPESSIARLNQGKDSAEWKEIAYALSNHTGLKMDELSPDVEWLTKAN